MNDRYNFVVTCDKGLEKYANLLETIVSEYADCSLIIFDEKQHKAQPKISKQKYVFIGPKCSEHLAFKSKYDDHGIKIGWKGAKGWIKVSDIDEKIGVLSIGGESFQNDFWKSYCELYSKYELDKADPYAELIGRQFEYKKYSARALTVPLTIKETIRVGILKRLISMIQKWIKKILTGKKRKESAIRNSLYVYSVIYFVDSFMQDFLKEELLEL